MDRSACLAIFESNVPPFFEAEEQEDFARFLDTLSSPKSYYVMKNAEGVCVACGGIKIEYQQSLAKLRWDMVLQSMHYQGLGKLLLSYRLNRIAEIGNINTVLVGTSEYAVGFYEQMGFKRYQYTPNGIKPELDEYLLKFEIVKDKRLVSGNTS